MTDNFAGFYDDETVQKYQPSPKPKPEPPLVERKGHTIRWSGQFMLRFFWAFVLGHVFTYMWIAVYYIVTQKNPTMKHVWDDYIAPWPLLRHFIRDYVEILLGTTAVWFALFSRWSKKNLRTKFTFVERTFDRIGLPSRAQRESTRRWQYIWSLPLTVLASVPGASVGFLVLYFLDRHESTVRRWINTNATLSAHASLADKYFLLFKADVPMKVAGVMGGLFFASVVFTKIAGDGQRAFARRRAARYLRTKSLVRHYLAKPRWPLPTPYRAEFRAMVRELDKRQWATGEPPPRYARWVTAIQMAIIPIVLALAYYGWWIMTNVAH